jgi:hypothetical protein
MARRILLGTAVLAVLATLAVLLLAAPQHAEGTKGALKAAQTW